MSEKNTFGNRKDKLRQHYEELINQDSAQSRLNSDFTKQFERTTDSIIRGIDKILDILGGGSNNGQNPKR